MNARFVGDLAAQLDRSEYTYTVGKGGYPMSEHNKAIVGRWLDEFWNKGNVMTVDGLAAPAVLMYYPLTGELRGRESL